MRSLQLRLAVWFGVSFVFLTLVFAGFTYRYLDVELHNKNWRRNYPEHPDWRLHGSYSEAEIRDILGELVETAMLYTVPLALAAIGMGYVLARKSVGPIASVNRQLQAIRPPNLSKRIELPEIDAEFRDLVGHTNDLLERLDHAFNDMSEYAAKVAHELRTPLAILRLKVEQAGGRIAPELAEELQAELHQLTHVVDQSLLIAKAEQRRLILNPRAFDLAQLVVDVAEDFALLAQEDGRVVRLMCRTPAPVLADPKYVRQIIHNFFTNTLKHGQGDIRIKVLGRGRDSVLTVSNWLRSGSSMQPETLGLGLRVVDTLLGLQPELKYQRRRGVRCYVVRLSFPAGKISDRGDSSVTRNAAAHDTEI